MAIIDGFRNSHGNTDHPQATTSLFESLLELIKPVLQGNRKMFYSRESQSAQILTTLTGHSEKQQHACKIMEI